MANIFSESTRRLFAAATGTAMAATLVMPATAGAQQNDFGATGYLYDLGSPDMVLEADFSRRDHVRYHGRAGTAASVAGAVVVQAALTERSSPPVSVPARPEASYLDASTIDQIVTSQNYLRSSDAPVLRLYQAYFDRLPDVGGAKYWLGIRRQGFNLDQIAGFMSGSQEFQNTYSGTSNAQYVDRVYTNVLGRSYDQGGFNYWLGLLNDGSLNRAGVVRWVTANAEFTDTFAFVPAGPVSGSALTIADPDPQRPRYNRDSYNTWTDADGDCQSERHEVLQRDSLVPVILSQSGCTVISGRWQDPYTDAMYTKASEVSIDHFIPLAEAERSGAWRWSADRKESFGNDITDRAALRVTGRSSNSSKGDSSPDEWLPPATSSHCDYLNDWVGQKARWDLTVTLAEAGVIADYARRCGFPEPQFTNAPTPVAPAPVSPTPVTPVAPTTPTAPTGGNLELVTCLRNSERVTVRNTGSVPISLAGWELHDEGRKHHETDLSRLFPSLAGGASVTFISGPNPVAGPGEVVFKDNHIWNNDGDTAFLLSPNGALVDELQCVSG